jgi:hypothetical protein
MEKSGSAGDLSAIRVYMAEMEAEFFRLRETMKREPGRSSGAIEDCDVAVAAP